LIVNNNEINEIEKALRENGIYWWDIRMKIWDEIKDR